MKIKAIILGVLLTISHFVFAQSLSNNSMDSLIKLINDKMSMSVGKPAPDIIYYSIEDHTQHHLNEFSGRVVLLNYWDLGCIPCLAEMPSLSRLQDDYRGAGFIVLFVSTDDFTRQSHFIASRKISGTIGWYDVSQVSEPYNIPCNPKSFLINRVGVIEDAWLSDLKYQELEAKLNRLIPKGKKRSQFVSIFYEYIDRIPMQRSYIYAAMGGIFLIIIGIISTVIRKPNQSSAA